MLLLLRKMTIVYLIVLFVFVILLLSFALTCVTVSATIYIWCRTEHY